MARKQIEGTEHVRRKMSTLKKAVIGIAALALASASGYLFVTKTDTGAKIQEKVAGITTEEGSGEMRTFANQYHPDDMTPVTGTVGGHKINVLTSTYDSASYPLGKIGGSVHISDDFFDASVKHIYADARYVSDTEVYEFKGWDIYYSDSPETFDDPDDHKDSLALQLSSDPNCESDIVIDKDITLVAIFYVSEVQKASFSYDFYITPAIGNFDAAVDYRRNDKAKKCEDSGSDFIRLVPEADVAHAIQEITNLNLDMKVPYTVAYSIWPIDQQNHSHTQQNESDKSSDTDSYQTNIKVNALFNIYVRDFSEGQEKWSMKQASITSDLQNDSDVGKYFDIEFDDSFWSSFKDINIRSLGHHYYIYIVPVTQQGTTYQVDVASADVAMGDASGSTSSSMPFSTTIKAMPNKGYEFDYWTYEKFGSGVGPTTISDAESSYSVNCNEIGINYYKAYFKRAEYSVYASNLPSDGGEITIDDLNTSDTEVATPGADTKYHYEYNSDGTVKNKPSVKVKITPNDGHSIDSWSYTLEGVGTVTGDSEEFEINDFEQDVNIQVRYTKDGKARIDVNSSPVTGGTATIKNISKTDPVEKFDYEEFTPGQEDAELKATPASGYVFLYWKDSLDKQYKGTTSSGVNTLTLEKVASSEKFTAYFAPETITIETDVYPNKDDTGTAITPGSVAVTGDNVTPESSGKYTAVPNTTVTIKATENEGYHFQKFVDGDGKEYNSNPLVRTDLSDNTKFTAIFIKDEFEIKAIASPITGGTVTVNGKTGSNTVSYNQEVTITATPNTTDGYVFSHFEDQNGKRYDANAGDRSLKFKAINGAETYKAIFVKGAVSLGISIEPHNPEITSYEAGKVEVSYTKTDDTAGSETIDAPSPNITDIKVKTNVTISATEYSKYHFVKFVDDNGQAYSDNPLTITNITDNTHLTAIFAPEEFEIKAMSSPSTGGTVKIGKNATSAREGSATFTYGDTVYITAIPEGGYIFRYFEDQNGNKYDGLPVSGEDAVYREFKAVNGPETYKAVFGMNKVNVDVKVDPSTEISSGPDDGKYVAGCAEVTYIPFGSTTNKTDTIDKDVSSTIAGIAGGTSVKIKAIEKTGYHFVKFIDDEGNTWNENPLVFGDLVENKNIEIIYVPDEFEIKAVATPAVGGKATVNGREGSNTVKHGQDVVIEATPASENFEFRYFEDQNGTKYKGNDGDNRLKFQAVNGPETFKAVFAMSEVTVSVKVDPSDTDSSGQYYLHGGFRVDYTSTDPTDPGTTGPLYEPKKVEHIKGQTSVKITALEGDGYRFSKFVDTDGNTFTENPLVYPDLVESKEVEVIFVPETFTISAQATPVTGGTVKVKTESDPAGREGSNTVAYNEKVTLVASPTRPTSPDKVSYEFRYFEDPNGSKYGGTKNSDGDYELSFNAVNGSETYKAVFAMSEVTVSVKVDPNKTNLLGNYTAGGYRIEYTNMAGKPQSSGEKYKPDTYKGIMGQTSVKITAIEGDGYHFAKFVDTDGNVFNDNPLIYPDLVEDKDVEVIFVPDEFTISAQATPVIGGRVDVTVGGSTREGSNKVAYDDEVTITAKPNSGFAFRYFEDQNGSKYSGTVADDGTASFKFRAVNGSETYKAVFAMSTVHLSVKVDPNTLDGNGKYVAGNFKVNYTYIDVTDYKEKNIDKEGDAPNFKIENIKGQTSVKITAYELSGYKFSKFIDDEGNTWTENPMVLGNLVENKDIEIIYVKDHWRIEGQASPETGGHVFLNGVESGLDVEFGDEVTIEAKPNEGYKFKFFKDELGNEYLSNPIKFKAINGNEKYVAYFSKDDVNITIDLAPEGSGTVRFNSEPPVSKRTTYPNNGKSSVTLTAAPKDGNKFLYWKDQDGNSYTDNPLVVSDIGRDLIFTAIFDNEYETIRAIASPASGGTITKIINADGSITLIAKAARGYKFANWTKPKGMTLASKFTIPANAVNAGDVYTAHFKIDPNYDAKSDITKEKFYREWRRVDTPNYTVTRDYIKMLASQAIADGHYGNATPELKTYNAIANARGYFSKAQAEEGARLDAKFGDSELMTAEGEKLTPDKLPDEDSYLNSAEKFTGKKFGDKYDTEILTVKRVLQPTGFNNNKRTYLWRYTGAEYKDNIYLLYEMDDKKTDFVTPIVDEDGVLKFTIDDLKDNDVVAVVRVKIK